MAASHGQGVANHVRATQSIQTRMQGARRIAVYLLSSASPADTPAASHQRPSPVAIRRAMAARVAVQNSSSGVSGVIVTEPTPNSSVAFSSAAATRPGRHAPNRSRPARASSHDPAAADSGASSRTPSTPCPARMVPARMNRATIGG